MWRFASAVVVAALVARPAAARADGGYAERMIAIDATADTLIAVGLVGDRDWVIYAGLAGYALGGPALHAAHGEWPRAGVSLGTRLGLPLATGAIGDAICVDDTGLLRCVGSAAIGAAIGMLAAQIIDPAVIVEGEAATAPTMLTVGGTF